MKRIFLITFLMLILSALSVIAADLQMKVIYTEGVVTLIKPNGAKTTITTGAIVNPGDRILTASRSVCDIEFAPKTYTRIGENSDLKIDEAELNKKTGIFGASEKKKINLNLANGQILSKVKKLGMNESFNVKTPVATVGVRGTVFSTAATPTSFNVSVFQGSVIVTNLSNNATAVVPAGQSLGMSASAKDLPAPAPMSTVELKAGAEIAGVPVAAELRGQLSTITSAPETPKINIVEQVVNTIVTPQIKPETNNATVIINFQP